MSSLSRLRTSPFYRLSCLSLGVSLLFVAACADDDDSPSTTDTGTSSATVSGTMSNTDATNTAGQTTGSTSGTGDATGASTSSSSSGGDSTSSATSDTSATTTSNTGGDTQGTGDGTDPTTSGTNDTDGTTTSTGTNACSQIPDTDECITCMKASETCCALADECWQDEAGCKCLINCLIDTQDAEACQAMCEPPSDSLKLQALVCYAGCQSKMLCPEIEI